MISKTEIDRIGEQIVNAAYVVHRELGPGLLESIYEVCMIQELQSRNLRVESQVKVPVFFKGRQLDREFLIDLLVEGSVIIELKSVELLLPVHEAQLLSYLRLANLPLGYLINFNVSLIKSGIKRKINGYF